MKKAIITFLLFATLLTHPSKAQASVGIEIEPSLIEAKVRPGITETKTIQITNTTQKNQTLSLTFAEFDPNTTWDGSIYLPTQKTLNETQPTVANYISIIKDGEEINQLSLSPGKQETIELIITPPIGTIEKDTNIILLFSSQTTGKDIEVEGRTGTNILLSVTSKNTQASFDTFTTEFMHWKMPIDFKIIAKNSSPHFTKSSARIEIKNMFGTTVGTITTPEKIVLSNSKRQMTEENNQPLSYSEGIMFGYYTATSTLSNSQEVWTQSFVVLPIIPLVILTLLLTTIVGIYLRVQKKI